MLFLEYVYLLTFEIYKAQKDIKFYYSTLTMSDHSEHTFGPTVWFIISFFSVNFMNIAMFFNIAIMKKELRDMLAN